MNLFMVIILFLFNLIFSTVLPTTDKFVNLLLLKDFRKKNEKKAAIFILYKRKLSSLRKKKKFCLFIFFKQKGNKNYNRTFEMIIN